MATMDRWSDIRKTFAIALTIYLSDRRGSMETTVVYCVRHGESTFNEWRKKSLRDFSWLWVRDPMLVDAPLSAKGRSQVENFVSELIFWGLKGLT